MPCLSVIIAHRFACGKKNTWQSMEKSQNIMKMTEDKNHYYHKIFSEKYSYELARK